jgi:2,4-dienoyl-CoA reductase-like NADH-dependent reductase (Old Yellow Enzyme family)
MSSTTSSLFQPLQIGDITLQHRIAMAPLTRMRANEDHVVEGALSSLISPVRGVLTTPSHSDVTVEYYQQRASTPGTLIISEATFISPQAGGQSSLAFLLSPAPRHLCLSQHLAHSPSLAPSVHQATPTHREFGARIRLLAGRRLLTQVSPPFALGTPSDRDSGADSPLPLSHPTVHAKGSFIFLQLWALGRAAEAEVLNKEGLDVVSASDIPFEGGATPRPLTEAEIKQHVGWYAQAAKNFVEEAGGDGVESELVAVRSF